MKEKKSIIKMLTGSREASLVIVLIVLCALVSLRSPSFLSLQSIADMLMNNTVVMIMALGMLCVLLIGGIDISIASTLGFTGMTVGMLLTYHVIENTFLLFLLAIGMGTICGTLVGLAISRGKVAPIIATMGFMYIFRGLAYMVSNSEWAGADALGSFKDFAQIKIAGFSIVVWIMVLCYIIFFVVMKWTKFGRTIYAVGSNREAAQISGINVANVELRIYAMMGALAGLCGALSVSIYASAQPNMQYAKEMDVIAACVIGGVSMSGGRGSVGGALLGSLVLAVIAKALPLVGIDALAQNTVKGVIILAVIILNVITQRMMNKQNLERREL